MKAIFAIEKRLLASNKISFILTALVVLCATSSGEVVLSNGNYTWLLAVMTPFFFVFYDYTKLTHLGASKKDYFIGCLISYGILALGISFVNTLIHLLIDPRYPAETVINLMDVCKWTENGIFIAALQQTFFLLFVMVFLHVLLSMPAALVWVAGRCDLGCKHLYFHTDCGIARDFVWFLPAYHAEQQRYFAHWYLLVVQRHGIACRPLWS